MNMIRTGLMAAVLTAMTAIAGQAAAGERVHTWAVGLDGDGQVSSWQLHAGEAGAYADGIAEQLQHWRFEPARAGGKDMLTFVRVVSQPLADGTPKVLQVGAGPAPNHLTLPEYPVAAQRNGEEGVVVLQLQLDADGQVRDPQVHALQGQVSRRMAASALAAARDWRFTPERIDGQAVAGSVLIPVCFHVQEDAAAACAWRGPESTAMSGLSIVSLSPLTRGVASRD